MKYLSTAEYAERVGITQSGVKQRCARGRIPGAIKVGEGRRATWCIPEDVPFDDQRVRSGKYIGAPRAKAKE